MNGADPRQPRTQLQLELPEDALWQVFWFGSLQPLTHAPTLWGIHTFFRRYGQAASGGQEVETVQRLVSLEHMHLLPIGRVVAEGSVLRGVHALPMRGGRPGRRASYILDFSAENTNVVTRSEIARPFPGMRENPSYEGMLIKVARPDTGAAVYVPCATLYQYFWGVSSRIARLVIGGDIEDLHQSVCDQSRTGQDGSVFRMVLRAGMRDRDARYLATLLAEPYAIEMGRWIGRRIREMALNKKVPQLEVLPPFPRELRVEGFFSGGSTGPDADVYLTHIVSTDLRPVWDELEFSRENEAKGDPDEAFALRGGGGYTMLSAPGANDPIDIVEQTPTRKYGHAELPVLPGLEWRFPEFDDLVVTKRVAEASGSSEAGTGRWSKFDGSFSSLYPGPVGTDPAAQAELNSDVRVRPEEEAEDSDDEHLDIHPQLSEIADAFRRPALQLQIAGEPVVVQRSFLNPYKPTSNPEGKRFFRVPRQLDELRPAWLFRDPYSRKTKRGVCIELQATSGHTWVGTRYILDFEPRYPRPRGMREHTQESGNGLLAVWFDQQPSSPEELRLALRYVIEAVALKGSTRLLERPVAGARTRGFRHATVDPEVLIPRIFAGKDQTLVERDG